MRIIYVHPVTEGGGAQCIAFVDVELDEHVRLYGLRLLRKPDGAHYLFAPQAGHRRTATFSKPLAERLTALAVEALETANGR